MSWAFVLVSCISPLVFSLLYVLGVSYSISATIGIALLMIIWWLDGHVPMGVTGLIPLVAFPILGIVSAKKISESYFSDGIVICWGSLIMAGAVEQYELHDYFAVKLMGMAENLGIFGILFGMILITGFLSMWLSNTATAALMMPISKAFIDNFKSIRNDQKEFYGSIFDLSIAYSSTIGGMSTLTGTGANIAMSGIINDAFDDENCTVTFLDWFILAFPLSVLNLVVLGLVLIGFLYYESQKRSNLNESTVEVDISSIESNNINETDRNVENSDSLHSSTVMKSHRKLKYSEYCVIIVFSLMAMLWITRDPPGQWGWSLLFPCSNCISDGTVAIFCSLILFLLPKDPPSCNSWALSSIISCFWFSSSPRSVATSYETLSNISVHNDLLGDDASSSSTRDIELRPMSSISLSSSSEQDTRHASPNGERVGGTILDWRVIKSLQWDIIFLLGGGFALSKGFQESGVSDLISDGLVELDTSFTVIVIGACLLACLLTNIMSNVAVANILLPALCYLGPKFDHNPLDVVAPVTLCISLALLFPIGTPPNAIALTNGNIKLHQMFFVGSILTCLYIILILVYMQLIGNHIVHTLSQCQV